MKKTDKKKLEEFIRVDHAGERGAIKIYEGQLLALSTFHKDEKLKKLIEDMKVHEEEHSNYFEKEIYNQQNFYQSGILWVSHSALEQQYLVRKQQCSVLHQ